MTVEAVRDKLGQVPARPGVYQYFDRDGRLLYVGKAKSLRNRVRSYFQPSARHPPRTANLVAEIVDLEVIVVDTELEALLLESNLIKRHRPRYNVVLRDDKHFPYLRLSAQDPYPRVSLVRRARTDGAQYFGPFTPASVARITLKLIPRYFRIATCNEVFDGTRRPCLYYHLDQCLAPCAGKTTTDEYRHAIDDVRLFLAGRHRDLESSLEAKMFEASGDLEFESAARYRDTLKTVRRLGERQHIASVGLEEQDYLAHHHDDGRVALQLFQMREGKVQGRREFTFDEVAFEAGAFYATVLAQYYSDAEPPREIYLPQRPDSADDLERWLGDRRGRRVHLRVPRRGIKARFLDLVRQNAALAFDSRFRSDHTHGVQVLDALADALGLEAAPFRIECFDISNIQGSDTVASMVVWEGGKPKKSDYRTFHIRNVSGPDDFASMAEAVTRRYRRLLEEDRRLPDLVLIDGGPGQRGAAIRALASVGLPMLPVVAIAKRDEELFLAGDSNPLRLDRTSPVLQLVQRIRDEAHRFAVTRHRRRRTKRTLRTELTDIPGVGPVTARKLLRAFGSARGVRSADAEAVAEVAGRRVAEAIRARYSAESDPE